MENSEEVNKKIDIERKRISEELTELIKLLLAFILLGVSFGYIGYTYSIANNQDIKHGIVFGSLFPLGIGLIKALDIGNTFIYIVYTIAYICLIEYVPTFVGFIILFTIIAIFIIRFICIERKNRTKGVVSKINNLNNANDTKPKTNTIIPKPKEIIKEDYIPIIDEKIEANTKNDFMDEEEKLEFECERCFKKISFEEYELNDSMCEDCYEDVHTDKHGNFHEDEYFDF